MSRLVVMGSGETAPTMVRTHRAVLADTFGDATPELVDYSGGGSSKEWTGTLDQALDLDFDTVVPGHGVQPRLEYSGRPRSLVLSAPMM